MSSGKISAQTQKPISKIAGPRLSDSMFDFEAEGSRRGRVLIVGGERTKSARGQRRRAESIEFRSEGRAHATGRSRDRGEMP